MKQSEVEKGGIYEAKVSDRVVPVKIIGPAGTGYYSKRQQFFAQNLTTRKHLKVSAQRLRRRIIGDLCLIHYTSIHDRRCARLRGHAGPCQSDLPYGDRL